MKVTVEHSAQMAAMGEAGIPIPEIVKKFEKSYSRPTIYRHSNMSGATVKIRPAQEQ